MATVKESTLLRARQSLVRAKGQEGTKRLSSPCQPSNKRLMWEDKIHQPFFYFGIVKKYKYICYINDFAKQLLERASNVNVGRYSFKLGRGCAHFIIAFDPQIV